MPLSDDRAFEDALTALYRRVNLETYRPRQPEALRLAPLRALLEHLGNPHLRVPVVHIAGTKGKGSTAAMMEAVLRAAGYRTGLYTSPHLHTVRERIQVLGKPLSKAAFVTHWRRLAPLAEADPDLSVFDLLTAMAFLAFAEADLDVVVVEVGLGGRLDSTNVVCPSLCLVTHLGLDHTEILGNTLAQIAWEKAGIFKPGVPAVAAGQAPEALAVLRRVAEERGTPFHTLEGWTWEAVRVTPRAQEGRIRGPEAWTVSVRLPLLGPHQRENALLVAAGVRLLAQRGWRLSPANLQAGLAAVHWPGRFEVLQESPPVVVDAAHTTDAAHALVHTLAEVFPNTRWHAVVGMSRDKDAQGFLKVLAPILDAVWVTCSRHPRAMPVEALAEIARAMGLSFRVSPTVEEAFRDAVSTGAAVLVTGSLFVVAEAREAAAHLGWLPLPETDPQVLSIPRPETPHGPR